MRKNSILKRKMFTLSRFLYCYLCSFWKSGLPTFLKKFLWVPIARIVSRPFHVFIWSRIYPKTCTWQKNISHAVAYSSTLRYIEDTLSNNTFYFHTYVVSIYPSELENKIPHGLRSASSVLYFFYWRETLMVT